MHSNHPATKPQSNGGNSSAAHIRTSPVNARWNRDNTHAPATPGTGTTSGTAGPRHELVRYRVTAGERVIYGERINGIVRVTDRPAARSGRSYLVERELHAKAELDALVADYVAQAACHDGIPCHVHW